MRRFGVPELIGRKPWLCNGRWFVWLNGTTCRLSHVIWEHFHGPIQEGFIVHHVNGDTRDDRLENLFCMKWGDHTAHHKIGNKYSLGHRHTISAIRKMSDAAKGNKSALGRKQSVEARQRISKGLMGHACSAETRARLRKAWIRRKLYNHN